jgi:radical SAM protein with 4Fe4S-binding SPASM domain
MDCEASLETTLGELGDELYTQLRGRRYPLGGSFELTERCNLRCIHCYINQPAGSQEASARELTLPQLRHILDQVADAGCLFVLLTGGEPLLRRDFADIWRYAKERAMLSTLFTNGTLLTPRIADFLAEYRPHLVEITLYGATQDTYEQVTGVPGSYARCMNGIQLLMDRGMRLGLKSMLLNANVHELEAMKSIAERFGVDYRYDGMLIPRLDGSQEISRLRLTPSEIVALDGYSAERQEAYDRLYKAIGAVAVRSEHVYGCGAGTRTFHIDCAGRLSMCMTARRPAYDLLQGSFRDGWDNFLGTLTLQKRSLDTVCRSCTVGPLCTQCPGWSQLVHGDDETPVDYVCEIGRLRAAQMAPSTASIVIERQEA